MMIDFGLQAERAGGFTPLGVGAVGMVGPVLTLFTTPAVNLAFSGIAGSLSKGSALKGAGDEAGARVP